MKLLLVRHAQSENNKLQNSIQQLVILGKKNAAEAKLEWMEVRQADPKLSIEGREQARMLGMRIKRLIRKYERKGGR